MHPCRGAGLEHQQKACCMTMNASGVDRAAVIDACLERMRSVARRMIARHPQLRRWEQSNDLVHNAYVRLHGAMQSPTLESPRSLVALAVTQLNREFIDAIRRSKTRVAWERSSTESVSAYESADDSLEDWSRFHEAIHALPDGQREAVQLLWYLELDQSEAADRLGVSMRTLRRYWHDGRAALRRKLPDLMPM